MKLDKIADIQLIVFNGFVAIIRADFDFFKPREDRFKRLAINLEWIGFHCIGSPEVRY